MLSENQINAIEERIGYIFKNKQLLQTAFTHSSFAYSHNLESNERLEFLGDSVLNFCTTRFLFDNFHFDEGVSSKIRAQLVSAEFVSVYINDLELEKFLLCDNFNPEKSLNVMGDLYEAIVGAMLLDSNLETCRSFIFESLNYSEQLVNDLQTKNHDYKTELQELLQKSGELNLKYELKQKTGPAHNPVFTIQIFINNLPYSTATGKSKKEAENLAAKETIETLKAGKN